MGIEENKAVVQRYFDEVTRNRNLDVLNEVMDSEVVRIVDGKELKGLEATKQLAIQNQERTTDIQLTIDEMVAEGDIVAVRGAITGMGTGKGGPAAGQQFSRTFSTFFQFKDRKIIKSCVLHGITPSNS